MDDDFNTAQGIGILFDMVRAVNRELDESDGDLPSVKTCAIQTARQDLLKMGSILGILNLSPHDYFDKKKKRGIEGTSIDAEWVERMITQRTEARASKNWERADEIRNELEKMNIVLEDRPDGTIWKIG